jgi:hypothetical protein
MEPLEVHRLHAASRERHLRQASDLVEQLGCRKLAQRVVVDRLRPLVERRPVDGGTFTHDRVVDEESDVFGHRVHPEERMLVGPPHPSRAGAMRIDEVDAERAVGEQLGQVGRDPLEEGCRGRAGADQRDLERRAVSRGLHQRGAA